MGFTLCLFCYKCKEYFSLHSPDILDPDVENIYEGGYNEDLETEIKSEFWGENANGLGTVSVECLSRLATKSDDPEFVYFVQQHAIHDQFCACDSYGNFPWEPSLDSTDFEDSEWQEWKGSMYHPRTLVEDLQIDDWTFAQFAILASVYLRSDNRLKTIHYHFGKRLKIKRLAEKYGWVSEKSEDYKSSVLTLKELCCKVLVCTHHQPIEDDQEAIPIESEVIKLIPDETVQYLRDYDYFSTGSLINEFGSKLVTSHFTKLSFEYEYLMNGDDQLMRETINSCSNLNYLSFEYCVLDDRLKPNIYDFFNIKTLQHLNISYIVKFDLKKFNVEIPLLSLNISGLNITDDIFKKVMDKCSISLLNLVMNDCSELTPSIFQYLPNKLVTLSMERCNFGSTTLDQSKNLINNINELSILRVTESFSINNVEWISSWIPKLSKLREISIGTSVENGIMPIESWFPKATTNIPHLRCLELFHCDLTDDGFNDIATNCKSIVKCSILAGRNLTDKVVFSLSLLPQLEHINLSGFNTSNINNKTGVDSEDLKALVYKVLAVCKSLKVFYLLGVPLSSKETIKDVKKNYNVNLYLYN